MFFLIQKECFYLANYSGANKAAQVNEEIRAEKVRVISVDGEMLGVLELGDALQRAYDFGMDLVVVSPEADFPVCKIMDYGKYKYDLQKKKSRAKKNQKIVEVKEIQLRPSIGENDLLIKCRAIERFIKSGNKVKVTLRFRGREIGKQEVGFAIIQKVLDYVAEYAKEEYAPKLDGQTITTILSSR